MPVDVAVSPVALVRVPTAAPLNVNVLNVWNE
jgi:hypothetical protein